MKDSASGIYCNHGSGRLCEKCELDLLRNEVSLLKQNLARERERYNTMKQRAEEAEKEIANWRDAYVRDLDADAARADERLAAVERERDVAIAELAKLSG